jgi:hypothetical protein
MTVSQFPKRAPAVHCWIKHLSEGNYSNEDRFLYTIFGKVKRARIVATIIDKREIITTQINNGDTILEQEDGSDLRMEFDLDDGTGFIRATIWQADPSKYSTLNKGDIVDVVGLIRKWKEFVTISTVDIIKKVDNPNFILLRNAEIIKRIRSGDIQKIPEITEEEFGSDGLSGEIDVNALFEGENDDVINDTKGRIYSLIKQSSIEGKGINFEEILNKLDIPEDDLRDNIKNLERESKIYLSEEMDGKYYHTY